MLRILVIFLSLLMVLSFPRVSSGATITWNGGGGNTNWTNTRNWYGGVYPRLNDMAYFGNLGTNTIVDRNITVSGIVFNRDANYTLTRRNNYTLNIGANGITITTPSSTPRTFTISSRINLTANQNWFVGNNNILNPTYGVNLNISDLALSGTGAYNITGTGFLGSGKIYQNDGTLTIAPSSASYTGAFILNNGTTNLNNNVGLGTISDITINGGQFNVNSTLTNANVKLNGGVLNVANTFNTGTLTINTGTLTGAGYVNIPVTVSNNGIINPGAPNSVGAMTIRNNLTFNSGSRYEWNLNDNSLVGDTIALSTGRVVNVSNSILYMAFGNNVNFADSFWNNNQSWVIISGTTLSGTGLFNLDANKTYQDHGTFALTRSPNGMVLSWTPVPEPSLIFLLVLGAIIVLFQHKYSKRMQLTFGKKYA